MSLKAAEELPRLQARLLPRLDWRDLFRLNEPPDDSTCTAFDAYFRGFLPPGPCVCCGEQQGIGPDEGRAIIDSIIGRAKFRWGLANGEGYCSGCGYPARAYHREVGPIRFFSCILQYHPDELHAKEAIA